MNHTQSNRRDRDLSDSSHWSCLGCEEAQVIIFAIRTKNTAYNETPTAWKRFMSTSEGPLYEETFVAPFMRRPPKLGFSYFPSLTYMEGPIMSKIDSVKSHFKNNKNAYVAGAVCLGVGFSICAVSVRANPRIIAKIKDVGDQAVVVVGDHNTVKPTMINLVERSTPSKPVHLVGTNLYFNSLSEAARETGHTLQKISRNINGHIPDVNGDVFELLEPAV